MCQIEPLIITQLTVSRGRFHERRVRRTAGGDLDVEKPGWRIFAKWSSEWIAHLLAIAENGFAWGGGL